MPVEIRSVYIFFDKKKKEKIHFKDIGAAQHIEKTLRHVLSPKDQYFLMNEIIGDVSGMYNRGLHQLVTLAKMRSAVENIGWIQN
jgi:hypothetical protein